MLGCFCLVLVGVDWFDFWLGVVYVFDVLVFGFMLFGVGLVLVRCWCDDLFVGWLMMVWC